MKCMVKVSVNYTFSFFFISRFPLFCCLFLYSSTLIFLPPLLFCRSEVRWNHQMMILSANAPVLVSHPFEVSVLRGHCPHALQDLWDFLETHCHGTCPNMRGERGRVRTPYLTPQKELWFVLQVRKSMFFRVKYP